MEKAKIENIIKNAVIDLKKNDIAIIELDEESTVLESIAGKKELERKLHEVCINHRLAVYIEKYVREVDSSYFVDIEYNRYYKNEKYVDTTYHQGNVRPDIVVHKRVTCDENQHLLVVEAKKEILNSIDESKIKALMKDPKYNYKYGARIKYGNIRDIHIDLYHKEENRIVKSVLPIP